MRHLFFFKKKKDLSSHINSICRCPIYGKSGLPVDGTFQLFPKQKNKAKQSNQPTKQKPLEILEVTEIINYFPWAMGMRSS